MGGDAVSSDVSSQNVKRYVVYPDVWQGRCQATRIYKEGAGGGNQTCSGSWPVLLTGKELKKTILPVAPYLSSEGNQLSQLSPRE